MTEADKILIKNNIEQIRAEIDGGKTSPDVTLMLATKTVDTERIAYAVNECGIKAIGENRVQELLDKYEDVKDLPCELHFIGTLQTNKVKYIVGKVDLIHSVDSEKLAKEIDVRASKLGIIQNILVEINCGKEESKSGIMPEDIYTFLENISTYSNIRICGVMTMAPKCENKSDYHNYFSQIYKLLTFAKKS